MATAKNPDYIQTRAPQVQPDSDAAAIVKWMDRELRAISAGQLDMTAVELRPIAAPPPQPREGMVVYADGTNWNPGGGTGPYVRLASAWSALLSSGSFAGILGVSQGGSGADLSGTGGSSKVVMQETLGGNFTVRQLDYTDLTGSVSVSFPSITGTIANSQIDSATTYTNMAKLGTITTGVWNGTPIGTAYGGTGLNLSTTGGPHQVLQQFTLGGALTVGQLAFSDISGIATLAQGGTGSNLNATGGAHQVLRQSASGAPITVTQLSFTDIAGIAALVQGGTGADLSATGGLHQVLKQSSAGAAVTVGQLAFSDISGALGLAQGGTGSDLSATGGAGQVLQQSSVGAAITVGTLGLGSLTGTLTNSQINPATTYSNMIRLGTIVAGIWASNAIDVANGGTSANLSATGGVHQVLQQSSTGAAITVGQLTFGDISGAIGLSQGGTGSDLSATGGTGQVLQQSSAGAAVTVGTLNLGSLSGTLTNAQVSAATTYSNLTRVGTIVAGIWAGTTIGVASGGTSANLSATGGAHQVLQQATTGAAITVGQLSFADISGGTITTGVWNASIIGVAFGGTGSDLSATGGTSQVLKQSTVGGAITVGQLTSDDIAGAVANSNIIVADQTMGANTSIITTDYLEIATGIGLEITIDSVVETG